MYAQLNASYTDLAASLNILDNVQVYLTEEHSWTDHWTKELLLVNVDPATLDTPEKRQPVYEEYLRNLTPGLRRTEMYFEDRKQLHPNLVLAKVESWIRNIQNDTKK